MQTTSLHSVIHQALVNSFSYSEYRDHITSLAQQNKTTGSDQSKDLVEFSKLNDKRMKRLDKTLKLDEPIKKVFASTDIEHTWLVISEGWCGDASQVLPVLHKLAELNTGIDLRIVLRDDNEALMNHFLTNGGKSIPILIMIDKKTGEIKNTWGPRPSIATQMVLDYKNIHGSLDASFKQELQVWYNKNKGINITEDLIKLL